MKSDSKSNIATLASDKFRHFFTFFIPKTTPYEVTRLSRNVSLRVLKKCCSYYMSGKFGDFTCSSSGEEVENVFANQWQGLQS
jgi:hypothetical protein